MDSYKAWRHMDKFSRNLVKERFRISLHLSTICRGQIEYNYPTFNTTCLSDHQGRSEPEHAAKKRLESE